MKTNHREAQTREDQITLKGTINPQTKPTSLVFPATKSLPSFSCMALKSRCLSRRGNRFIWSPWSAGVPSSCSPPPNWIIASMFCQAGAQPTPQPHSQPNPQPWSYPPSYLLTILPSPSYQPAFYQLAPPFHIVIADTASMVHGWFFMKNIWPWLWPLPWVFIEYTYPSTFIFTLYHKEVYILIMF